jgi:peptidoglycan hydrolase-like protein with peptidoglycan-binding domain
MLDCNKETTMSLLMRGLQGEPVRVLQQKLGVDADGVFGLATEKSLRDYQSQNGLQVDGIAGPDTFVHMGLWELVLLAPHTHGEAVKKLQTALGIEADGKYGPGTAEAVRKFQGEQGLAVDGLAGPLTLAKVPGFEITEEQVAASTISDSTPAVDPDAATRAAQEPPPPEEHKSVVAKIEDKIAKVGHSIWSTVKSIF